MNIENKRQLPKSVQESMRRMGTVFILVVIFVMALFLFGVISQDVFIGLLVGAATIQSVISFRVLLLAKKEMQKNHGDSSKMDES